MNGKLSKDHASFRRLRFGGSHWIAILGTGVFLLLIPLSFAWAAGDGKVAETEKQGAGAAEDPQPANERTQAQEQTEERAQEKRPEPSDVERALAMIGEGRKAIRRIRDFTAVFHKKEYLKKQLPEEVAFMKWRRKPRAVYMKWVGEEKKNQEILWGPEMNGGKIKAHAGGFLKLITVNLDPKGSMAMKDNRHPVTEAGFDHTGKLIERDMQLILKYPGGKSSVKALGEKIEYGAKSYCYEATMDKDAHPEFYARKARICTHMKLKLPNHVQTWDIEDGKMRLIEEYGYENIRVNVGLTDADFDPDNPEYAF